MSRHIEYVPPFSTASGSPELLLSVLSILTAWEGAVLDERIVLRIAAAIVGSGQYRTPGMPDGVKEKINNGDYLTDSEVQQCLTAGSMQCESAGLCRDWRANVYAWFRSLRDLGLVYCRPGEKIMVSTAGRKAKHDDAVSIGRQVFLNALVKHQSGSPFCKAQNGNVPFVLLLRSIALLNDGCTHSGNGILRSDIPVLLQWGDNDTAALCQYIRQTRGISQDHQNLGAVGEFGQDAPMYPDHGNGHAMITKSDEFVRNARLTGLISVREGGLSIDINCKERATVDYILGHYPKYQDFRSEKDYFQHMETVDEELMEISGKSSAAAPKGQVSDKWLEVYPWQKIKREMYILSEGRISGDRYTRHLLETERQEFLTLLAIKSQFPSARVTPNFIMDDEGLPVRDDGMERNHGDIGCLEDGKGILIETAMTTGIAQTGGEIWPTVRHLERFCQSTPKAMCHLVVPEVAKDTVRIISYLSDKGLCIAARSIPQFLDYLESSETLYDNGL